MSLSGKHVLAASALLLVGLPVFANENSSAAGVASAPRAYVKCPGLNSVPMTSDAEQVLPLAQVASLVCGDTVAVVSDNEGYTTRVRTADGKEGYVARMYLTNAPPAFKPKPRADANAQPASAAPHNGVVRWMAGAPGCDTFQSHGRIFESVTANGITVQVSLQDTSWKLLATVAVSNQSEQNIYVFPNLMSLDELIPNLRNLPEQNPAKLAHNEANHQLLRDQANAQPSRSAVASVSSSSALSYVSYRASEDFTPVGSDNASAQTVALKTVDLASGQKTVGVLWYARAPGAHELSMRLSLGDLVFDFPFSFEPKK